MDEQIYFGLSADGRNWTSLNNSQPVLVSRLGEQGARDAYLLRAHEGGKFYIIATDLSINRNRDWTRSVRNGSRSLLIWESNDLVHWSDARLVQVAPEDAGCTWAPEAIYNEETRDYLVFWASTTKRDNYQKQRIWAARTRDFRTFSAPFLYIEKPTTIIDTTIVRDGNNYYRFTKDEKQSAITMEVSDRLMGTWREIPAFSLAQMRGFEGPECYLLEPAMVGKPATWCLILDQFTRNGYQPFVCQDLSKGQFTPATGFAFPYRFRHGSVLALTPFEYQRLQAAFGKTAPINGTATR